MSDIERNTMTIEVREEPTEPTYHTVFSELREIHRIVDRIEKAVGRKETPPEISALAAKYLAMSEDDLVARMYDSENKQQRLIARALRKLAAALASPPLQVHGAVND